MRKLVLLLAASVALSAAAQQRLGTNQPVLRQGPVVAPAVKLPTLSAPLKLSLPAIESVERAGPSPGPAADAVLFNGEAIRVRGRNFGSPVYGYHLALRRGDRQMPLKLNPNVAWTATTIAAYVPGVRDVARAGLGEMDGTRDAFEVVVFDSNGRATASRRVTLQRFPGPGDDFDGDGARADTTDGGFFDCDDFDGRRYFGNIEVCDLEGLDEDCDPQTYGSRDGDGDHFDDARCFNLDDAGNKTSGGNDCNDNNVTANPIRPENCPVGR